MVSAQEKESSPVIERRVEDPGEIASGERREQIPTDYLEKIEREPSKNPVLDDTGQVLLNPSHSEEEITLPLTEDEIKKGLHHKIADALYWLAAWCIRISKKAALAGIKVVFRPQ